MIGALIIAMLLSTPVIYINQEKKKDPTPLVLEKFETEFFKDEN